MKDIKKKITIEAYLVYKIVAENKKKLYPRRIRRKQNKSHNI